MRRIVAAAGMTILLAAAAEAAGPRGTAESQQSPQGSSTYIGCVRADSDGRTLKLTEVGGPDVPESRTWRSLFLTPERVLEIESSGTEAARQHVGHTVRITGRRDGKTLHAQSIRFVGATCK